MNEYPITKEIEEAIMFFTTLGLDFDGILEALDFLYDNKYLSRKGKRFYLDAWNIYNEYWDI